MKEVIQTQKVVDDIYAKLYSDLHYVPGDDLSFLRRSIDRIMIDEPHYIFFLGDLINEASYTVDELKKVYELLYKMAKYSKLIMVLGNHDQLVKDDNGKWVDFYNVNFVNELKNTGAIVLQNEYFEDDKVLVYGTRFSGDYYEQREPTSDFLETMKLADFRNSDKFNILMEHSPKHTFDKQTIKICEGLKDADLTLAGHYHNGCIPWYIDKVLPGNFGIVDPYLNMFPSNARGMKEISDGKWGIISMPITTFSKGNRLRVLQPLFYPLDQNILIRKR